MVLKILGNDPKLLGMIPNPFSQSQSPFPGIFPGFVPFPPAGGGSGAAQGGAGHGQGRGDGDGEEIWAGTWERKQGKHHGKQGKQHGKHGKRHGEHGKRHGKHGKHDGNLGMGTRRRGWRWGGDTARNLEKWDQKSGNRIRNGIRNLGMGTGMGSEIRELDQEWDEEPGNGRVIFLGFFKIKMEIFWGLKGAGLGLKGDFFGAKR